jgi:hypothetical protein
VPSRPSPHRFLPQLHLLHQELGWHGGVGLEGDVDALKLEQVTCTAHGVFQCLKSFIDPGRPLQGRPALSVAGVGEAIGMHARLDVAICLFQRFQIKGKDRREAEQLEVTARRR